MTFHLHCSRHDAPRQPINLVRASRLTMCSALLGAIIAGLAVHSSGSQLIGGGIGAVLGVAAQTLDIL